MAMVSAVVCSTIFGVVLKPESWAQGRMARSTTWTHCTGHAIGQVAYPVACVLGNPGRVGAAPALDALRLQARTRRMPAGGQRCIYHRPLTGSYRAPRTCACTPASTPHGPPCFCSRPNWRPCRQRRVTHRWGCQAAGQQAPRHKQAAERCHAWPTPRPYTTASTKMSVFSGTLRWVTQVASFVGVRCG